REAAVAGRHQGVEAGAPGGVRGAAEGRQRAVSRSAARGRRRCQTVRRSAARAIERRADGGYDLENRGSGGFADPTFAPATKLPGRGLLARSGWGLIK